MQGETKLNDNITNLSTYLQKLFLMDYFNVPKVCAPLNVAESAQALNKLKQL